MLLLRLMAAFIDLLVCNVLKGFVICWLLAKTWLSFFLEQVSATYQAFFLQPLVEYITDKQPEVRQAATYGVGVMAQFGGPVFADVCAGKL